MNKSISFTLPLICSFNDRNLKTISNGRVRNFDSSTLEDQTPQLNSLSEFFKIYITEGEFNTIRFYGNMGKNKNLSEEAFLEKFIRDLSLQSPEYLEILPDSKKKRFNYTGGAKILAPVMKNYKITIEEI